jgi:hypothetical protein
MGSNSRDEEGIGEAMGEIVGALLYEINVNCCIIREIISKLVFAFTMNSRMELGDWQDTRKNFEQCLEMQEIGYCA